MTPREIFDRVRTHLLAQGTRADRPDAEFGRQCVFRTADGRSCAVGCLIPAGLYNPATEGRGVISTRVADGRWRGSSSDYGDAALAVMLEAAGIPATEEVRDLLIELQKIHDVEAPERWATELALLEARLAGTLDGQEVGP